MEEVKKLRANMQKKQNFEEATRSLVALLTKHYHEADKNTRDELYEACKRAFSLLRSRYTGAKFWQAGKKLFETLLSLMEDEAERSKEVKGWIDMAAAEAEKSPEKEEGPPKQEAPTSQEPPRMTLHDLLQSLITEVDVADLLHSVPIGDMGGPPPASRDARFNLDMKTVQGKDVVCAVCQEEFPVNGKAKMMPCGHPFHYDCLMEWLERKNSCPICRYSLPSERVAFDLAEDLVRARDPTASSLYS
mmetsp:Transcript_18119/g.59535  ORF Transcript_18119/g.59535 Transcript_18119/m.59535 type:complete len:247 (-) Transcript_18119:884-1624(-)